MGDDAGRKFSDPADEIGIEPPGRSHHLDLQIASEYLLPKNAKLQVGQAVTDTTVDPGAVGQVLARFRAVHDEGVRAFDDALIAVPDTYHITTLSPCRMCWPASSVSRVAVRRI